MYPAVCLCAPILKWVCPAERMWTNGFCFSYSEQDILYWPRLFRNWIHGDSNLSKFPLGTHIGVNLIPFYSFPKKKLRSKCGKSTFEEGVVKKYELSQYHVREIVGNGAYVSCNECNEPREIPGWFFKCSRPTLWLVKQVPLMLQKQWIV